MCLGIPGQIIEIGDATAPMAAVLVAGTKRMVDLSLVCEEGVAPGDWVLVHAGFALSTIDEREAHETLALLHDMSVAYAGEPPPAPPEIGAQANERPPENATA